MHLTSPASREQFALLTGPLTHVKRQTSRQAGPEQTPESEAGRRSTSLIQSHSQLSVTAVIRPSLSVLRAMEAGLGEKRRTLKMFCYKIKYVIFI